MLSFADDIAILAERKKTLKLCFNKNEWDFSEKHNMKIDKSKTKGYGCNKLIHKSIWVMNFLKTWIHLLI